MREISWRHDLVVLSHDDGVRLGAKRLQLRTFTLSLTCPCPMIQILIGPDMHHFVQWSYFGGPPADELGIFVDDRQSFFFDQGLKLWHLAWLQCIHAHLVHHSRTLLLG